MLTTKSVNGLIYETKELFIPDYQRGYRWTDVESRRLAMLAACGQLKNKENGLTLCGSKSCCGAYIAMVR